MKKKFVRYTVLLLAGFLLATTGFPRLFWVNAMQADPSAVQGETR